MLRSIFSTTVAFVCLAGTASAATITSSYAFTATGMNGPTSNNSGAFTIRWDAEAEVLTLIEIELTVGAVTYDTGNAGVRLPVRHEGFIVVGGTLNGVESIAFPSNDFSVAFWDNAAVNGPLSRDRATKTFHYSHAGGHGSASSPPGIEGGTLTFELTERVITGDLPPVLLVPEPASWALLMLGFGVAGARLRRRPTATT